jgi:two-component system, OmpR family, sensor histidine kinase TctE
MKRSAALTKLLGDLLASRESVSATFSLKNRWRRKLSSSSDVVEGQTTLFGEILDWMFAPLLLLWPLSIAITFVVARNIADQPFDTALQDRLKVLASQLRYVNERPVIRLRSGARDLLRNADNEPVLYQFVDSDGKVILGDSAIPRPPLYDFAERNVPKLRQAVIGGEEMRVAYMTIDPSELEVPTRGLPVLVQVAEGQQGRIELANEIIRGVILPQFVVLPLALVLVWYGLNRGLRPLRAMQRQLAMRRADDLSPINPRAAPEEISPLVDSFNELLVRLNQNLTVQKRFLADAAHQMKTPLAGLRSQAELVARAPSAEETQRGLDQLIRSADRAAHVINQLLALARMENLRETSVLAPMELSAFVREIMLQYADRALERSIDFGFESDDDPAPIVGHPILLRELFANLIDNALRYTPKGGEVTVSVRSTLIEVIASIEDSGVGIPESDRELVFERFYRVLGNEADGSGLGLAIAREIASQHDARIVLEDARPGLNPPGTRIEVVFAKTLET